MTRMCVSVEVEDGGVEVTSGRGCTNPGRVGFVEAEVRTRGVSFKPSVGHEVLSFVPSGEGDLKVALSGVAVWVSPASGATTSGTSSELSLRFMAMVVVWYVLVVFILAGSFNQQDLNFRRIDRD